MSIIDSQEQALHLAHALIGDLRAFHGEAILSRPDDPAISEARALYQSRVSASLHGLFEHVLQNSGASTASEAAPHPGKMTGLERGIAFGLVGLVAATGICAYAFLIGPGTAAKEQALNNYIHAVRAGKAAPPLTRCTTTDAALRAIAASSSHSITGSRGGFSFNGAGHLCFEVAIVGPAGRAEVIVNVAGKGAEATATHVGLAPPCTCQHQGGVGGCK